MERSFIRERHQIITDTYYDLNINDAFMDEIKDIDWCNSYKTNVGAKMSAWDMKSDNITSIFEWVESLLFQTFPDLPPDFYTLHEAWYARYDEGDRTKVHDHRFLPWSFVYFIKSPPGSSSLYFPTSNKEITPDEGRIVVFPGNIEHYVPENKSNGRIVLVGNLK